MSLHTFPAAMANREPAPFVMPKFEVIVGTGRAGLLALLDQANQEIIRLHAQIKTLEEERHGG
jgi:hypothetical protein